MLIKLSKWFSDFLHRPARVLMACLALAFLSVLLDGSFLQLWSLHRELGRLNDRITDAEARSRQLEFRIQEAQQPEFIERQARDQFDLVKEGDLIFVFSDDSDASN